MANRLAPEWVGMAREVSLDWEVLSIVFSPTAPSHCALDTEGRKDACVSAENCQLVDFVIPIAPALAWAMN